MYVLRKYAWPAIRAFEDFRLNLWIDEKFTDFKDISVLG